MALYYQDEHVTLYHGDCLTGHREWLDADVLVTDPPYGIGWKQPNLPALAGSRRGQHGALHKHDGIQNDATTDVRDAALLAWGEDRAGFVFAAWREQLQNAKQTIVWLKPPTVGVIGAHYGYRRDTELIHLTGNHEKRSVARSSVLQTKGTNTAYQDGTHPHAKPISLLETLIEWAPPGTVADPFAGSGSTLIAARNLGRKAIGVELEERYCEIIARRLSQGAFDFSVAAT